MKSILILLIALVSSKLNAQSANDFFKLNHETEIIVEGAKIEKKQFYIVNSGSYLLDKSLLDTCKNYIERFSKIDTGNYLNEYYFFFKETNTLNRNTLDKQPEELLSNNFNNIIAILRYIKTAQGVNEYFSTLREGQIDKLYINGVEKDKL